MTALIVTGTDTGIGKTIFAAALTHALGAFYWKPVQSGLEEATDSETVARFGSVPPERILPEAYRLKLPASPHLSAEAEGGAIDPARLALPTERPLVIEGAGGLMVPLTRSLLTIDLFALWSVPVVLCARTTLGTINHTLLSIEALKARGIPIKGIAFIGEEMRDSQDVIAAFSGVKVLGRLPPVAPLTPEALQAAFAGAFAVRDFL